LEVRDYKPRLREKKVLLKLARNSICRLLSVYFTEEKIEYHEWLSAKIGAFVSIHNKSGELRGCIGRFLSDIPLYLLVQELAVSASSKDYRFNPVKECELDTIVIEISVLSPLNRIYSLKEIVRGKHGIYIKKGNQSGTFLPQVILETGWDIETFVGRCSRDKAGIGWDGWKEAELYTYTAEIFSEEAK